MSKLYDFIDFTDNKKLNDRKNIIGIIDSDLLDKVIGKKLNPNLALLKISQYYKNKGYETKLLLSYEDLNYNKIFLSKVFSETKIPLSLKSLPQIEYGGTGFFFDKAPNLPDDIEHCYPDYNLYDEYLQLIKDEKIKLSINIENFTKFSFGFMTRGCFRKCEFCVNKKYDKAILHSPLEEFYNKDKPYIKLWDDNVLSYSGWKDIIEKLQSTGKQFIFQQGLDLRLITESKAKLLAESNYYQKKFIFAFDNYDDRELIEKKLSIWSEAMKNVRKDYYAVLYVLCAFKSQDEKDLWETFKRVQILITKYHCVPYIMQYKDYKNSKYKYIYNFLKNWCNNRQFILTTTFKEYIYTQRFTESKTTVQTVKDKQEKRRNLIEKQLKDLINYNSEFEQFFNMRFI